MRSSNGGSTLPPYAAAGPLRGPVLAPALEKLYRHYNSFEHIHPDPLEFVYLYDKKPDREIIAFIASALAYGRVQQILKSVGSVLDVMGPSPSSFLLQNGPDDIAHAFRSFKHRFTTGEMLSLLTGIGKLIAEYGSLESCFLTGFSQQGPKRPARAWGSCGKTPAGLRKNSSDVCAFSRRGQRLQEAKPLPSVDG